MSELLTSKIAAVRSKQAAVALGTGLAIAAGFFVVSLGAMMLLDWWLDLPRWARALMLALQMAGIAWILVRFVGMPILYGPDDEELALAVERHRPEFGTRLIASVQLARPEAVPAGASVALVRAMITQTEKLAEPMNFDELVKTDRMLKFLGGAAVLLVLGAAGTVYGGARMHAMLERAFLGNVPLPTLTRVVLISGENGAMKVARGDNVELLAQADGHVPDYGTLEVAYRSGRKQSLLMSPTKTNALIFAYTLDAVQESFDYRVRLYDGRSQSAHVDVLPRPTVAALACYEVFPAYTGQGEELKAPGDLALLSGSKLRLKITSSKPVRLSPGPKGEQNVIHRFGDKGAPAQDLPLTVNPQNPRELTATLEVPEGTSGFAVGLVDQDNLTSKDPAVYRIELVPDRPPTIHITSPERKEELVTRVSTVDLGFVAEDDFRLGSVTLKYKIDDGELRSVPLNLVTDPLDPRNPAGPRDPRVAHNHLPWEIAKVPVPDTMATLEGHTIEYYLEVLDTRPASLGGPGKGLSDRYMLRVVTKAEKQAELMGRLSDSLGAIKDVSENQEKTNQELGTLITEQATPAPKR